jgi:hypothetical protein
LFSHRHWSSGQQNDSRLAQESPVPANGRFGGLKKKKERKDELEAEKE